MENQVEITNKQDKLLQFGLMSAAISSLFFIVLYIGGLSWHKSYFSFLTYLIPIVFSVWACRSQRKIDGYLPFKSAIRLSFGVLVITTLATSFVSYILFNFIDPAFAEGLKQLAISETQKFMEKFNVPADEIDKTIDGMLKENLFSLNSIFKSFMFGCIINFIVAAIISAIMKKDKEVFSS